MLLNNNKRKNPDKFNPGLSANRPSNNWALDDNKVKLHLKREFALFQTFHVLLIRRALEIRKFDIAVVQRRLRRNEA